jgi:oligopeptide transport system ATP-binding protein
MNKTLLEVSDLCTRFHTPEGTVFAVNGISFHLGEGETLAVVGESGCGKSVSMLSILKLISIPPGEFVRGTIIYREQNLSNKTETEMEDVRGKEIAMIFQDPMTSLNPVLTIGRQITESLQTHLMMDNAAAERRAAELLEWVGIPDAAQRLKDYPHQFSGGMRQRVMIAMDVTIQAQIVELVARVRDQSHMAVIWITHDLGVVAGLADRVLVMYAGYIVEEAEVDNLYEKPCHPYTLALLAALPRVDRRRDRRLKSIPGAPPNLLVEPRGCSFAPRCEFAFERCQVENPPLCQVEPAHSVACWLHINGVSA